jgi:hypothetical protein
MGGILEPPCVTETGTARPICNPSSEAPPPRTNSGRGLQGRRSPRWSRVVPSIDAHQEWSEHSARQWVSEFIEGYFQSNGEKHKREERGENAKKVDGVFLLLRVGQWHSIVWLLNRRLVHMDIRSFLVF